MLSGIFTQLGSYSMPLRHISTSLVEGCAITSLQFDIGLRGKDFRAEASLGDPHEGTPGFVGSPTGPWAK
jgi:hypothetical protein